VEDGFPARPELAPRDAWNGEVWTGEPPDDDVDEALVEDQDWTGLELVGARFSGSRLAGVDLTDASWRNVKLVGCRFERVDLSGARLDGAVIDRCEFVGCRMTGVQLLDSTLKDVAFEDCRLDYASVVAVRTTGPVAVLDSILTNANLARCRLSRLTVTRCRLTGTELDDCDLRGADLRGNDLSELTGLRSLTGARIDGTQLPALAIFAARALELVVD
jgi:uncharacterized protein YjbI with pentapeptide repeats